MISYQFDQRDPRQKARGTKDQFLIDQTILRNCRKRHTNLGMAWIDYRKAYDMVHHSWILERIELVQVSDNIFEFVKRSTANWPTELTSCGERLAKVNIRRQLCELILELIPLNNVLRKAKARRTLGG